MVRIRLRKTGGRNQPSYRIVAADKQSPRDGRFLEILGHYNPRTEPATIDVKEDRLFHWLKNGADPSESVVRVLKSVGTWDRWERFKAGESLETLLEEAAAEFEERVVDPRTKRTDFTRSKPSKKAVAKAEAEAEEEASPEPAAEETSGGEAEAEVEAQAEPEPAVEEAEEPEAEDSEEAETEPAPAEDAEANEPEESAVAEDETDEAEAADEDSDDESSEDEPDEEAEPEAEAADEADEGSDDDDSEEEQES